MRFPKASEGIQKASEARDSEFRRLPKGFRRLQKLGIQNTRSIHSAMARSISKEIPIVEQKGEM